MSSTISLTGVRRRKAGFTLVEIMIVVVIIGLLAAIAVPAWTRARQRSQVNAFVNDLKKGIEAVQRCAFETGEWPTDSAAGTCPTEMTGYLAEEYWSKVTPLGGNWDWNYSGGTAPELSVANVVLANAMPDVDAAVDDGNLSTGAFRGSGTTYTYAVSD